MGGFGDAIKYLYTQFILRDVLSFITPGAIVVLTAFFLFSSWDLHLPLPFSVPWPFYIPLFGLFYIVGYAIQCAKNLISNRYSEENTDSRKQDVEKTIVFLNNTARVEWARQFWDRTVTHRQMCLNNLGAVIIAGLLLIASAFITQQYANILIIVFLVVILSLAVFYDDRDSKRALDTIIDKINSLSNRRALKKDN